MSKSACKSCAFFEKKTASIPEAGQCRFNAPTFLSEEEKRGVWPVVAKTDWCGNFETQGA